MCGGPLEFRQFKEVFQKVLEFRQFKEVFEFFEFHNLSDKYGDRLFRASLRKKKKEEQKDKKRVLSSLNKHQHTSCV